MGVLTLFTHARNIRILAIKSVHVHVPSITLGLFAYVYNPLNDEAILFAAWSISLHGSC